MALMFLLKFITIVNANDTHLENIIAIDNLLLPLTVMPKTAELLMPLTPINGIFLPLTL